MACFGIFSDEYRAAIVAAKEGALVVPAEIDDRPAFAVAPDASIFYSWSNQRPHGFRLERRRICERCHGEGSIPINPGWPDPQTERWERCPDCHGKGTR